MAWPQPKLTANVSLIFTKGKASETQRGLRFISKTAESSETMVRLMLHKLTAASCIYTFMLVRPALRPAGPWAWKQRATATNTCARARTHQSAHTLTRSTTEGPLCSARSSLAGPCHAHHDTPSPGKMVSAHSSSSKPQTNPLLRGILIGWLEGWGKKRKEIKWPMTRGRVLRLLTPLSSDPADTCDTAQRDLNLSEVVSEGSVDDASQFIDDT